MTTAQPAQAGGEGLTPPDSAKVLLGSPEDVAARLTKRSRRALPLIGVDWTDESWDKCGPNPNDAYSLGWGRDYQFWLVEQRIKPGTGVVRRQTQWQWRLTAAGLAVKAYLEQEGGR